ncbi:MAG: hypothetical protein ACRD1S_03875, partial [Vicinamibacterales bacterium]
MRLLLVWCEVDHPPPVVGMPHVRALDGVLHPQRDAAEVLWAEPVEGLLRHRARSAAASAAAAAATTASRALTVAGHLRRWLRLTVLSLIRGVMRARRVHQRAPVVHHFRPPTVNLQPRHRFREDVPVKQTALRAGRSVEVEQAALDRHQMPQALDVALRHREETERDPAGAVLLAVGAAGPRRQRADR